MMETQSAVSVDLRETRHAVTPKVRARLTHLVGGDGVEPGFTCGIGNGQCRHYSVLAEPIPIKKRDALNTRSLTTELVEERLPNGLRKDEAHSDRCSGEVQGPPRDDSALRQRCGAPAAISGSRSGNDRTCSTPRSC